ncbi:ABC transporter permease [Propionibacteriaceae bacterium Y1685]
MRRAAQNLINEFAKMRHLRLWLVVLALVLGVAGLSVVSAVASPDFADPASRSWRSLLAGLSLGTALVQPLLLAVLASRLVDIEHQGQGWILPATSGLTPGRLLRAKLLALGIVLTVTSAATHLLVLAFGLVMGIAETVPTGVWVGAAVGAWLVGLIILALHLWLSTRIENQLVGLGVGVLGTLLAISSAGLPAWANHLTPWGHFAFTRAAEWRGDELVLLQPGWPGLIVLVVIGGALFALATGRFDRQEV